MRFRIAIIILTMKNFSGEGRAARGGTPLWAQQISTIWDVRSKKRHRKIIEKTLVFLLEYFTRPRAAMVFRMPPSGITTYRPSAAIGEIYLQTRVKPQTFLVKISEKWQAATVTIKHFTQAITVIKFIENRTTLLQFLNLKFIYFATTTAVFREIL